jgi:hypothetical protein
MTAPTPTGRRRIAWIVFSAIVLLGAGGVAWRVVPTLAPLQTANGFCDDARHQRYDHIYNQWLSPAARATVSDAAFDGAEALADRQAGNVTGCDVSPFTITVSGQTAQATVTEHRAGGVTVVQTLHLSGADWLIAAVPDPAVFPYATALAYCDALTGQNYAAAFQLLASGITAQLSQQRFVALANGADQAGGSVTTCMITQLQLSGNGAIAQATLQTRRSQATATSAPVLALARQSDGAWKITTLPSV